MVESEEPVQQHLEEFFARVEPECVLDVGANAGQYAELLRQHGYRGWIVSLEPVRAAFEALAETARGDRRWRVFQLALGARTERRRIAVAGASELSSFRPFSQYGRDELPGAAEITHYEEVDVAALSGCWSKLLRGLPQHRVFLKLDTQGWDLEVLGGAEAVLDRLVGIQLEASLASIYEEQPAFTQTIERVVDLGFELTGIYPVSRDSLFRLIEVDCVFINSSHVDAPRWREKTWTMLEARFREQIATTVPAGASFTLIDDGTLGIEELSGRRALPFLERDGEYWGAPEDGEQAVAELSEVAARGVHHVVVAWPSFWWLEEYPELERHLRSHWQCVAESEAAVVFERRVS